MCCHDCLALWSFPQRVDGRAQPSYYASQPAEKVRQHREQLGKSTQRYGNLHFSPFTPVLPFMSLGVGKMANSLLL